MANTGSHGKNKLYAYKYKNAYDEIKTKRKSWKWWQYRSASTETCLVPQRRCDRQRWAYRGWIPCDSWSRVRSGVWRRIPPPCWAKRTNPWAQTYGTVAILVLGEKQFVWAAELARRIAGPVTLNAVKTQPQPIIHKKDFWNIFSSYCSTSNK